MQFLLQTGKAAMDTRLDSARFGPHLDGNVVDLQVGEVPQNEHLALASGRRQRDLHGDRIAVEFGEPRPLDSVGGCSRAAARKEHPGQRQQRAEAAVDARHCRHCAK